MTITNTEAAPVVDERIRCELCGALTHSIKLHLTEAHEGITEQDYKNKYPGAPLMSNAALRKIEEHKAAKARKEQVHAGSSVKADLTMSVGETEQGEFHKVFGLGDSAAARSARGTPIAISVIKSHGSFAAMVPDLDPAYVFNVDTLKSLVMGIEMNIPVYLWGHAGTGKTTIYEQIAARTGRPMLRVQHTANMEEEHVIGGYRLRDGVTVFDLGPLAMAMRYGWLYLADEYDFGRPEVLSLYQPVLEGKPLVIKEADLANRVIHPHPNFRIVATGNTNGQGDETGLYNGTNLQNAANYERFGIVEKMEYMDPAVEALLIAQKAGISREDATKLVDFATRVRAQFDASKLSNPISPRSLIYAARIGMARASYIAGLEKAYLNRLTSTDREAARQLANRTFGS